MICHTARLTEFLTIAGIMMAGSMLQGAAGFGFNMLAVPLLMTMVGMPSYAAITYATVGGTAQMTFGLYTRRKAIRWSRVAWMLAIGWCVVPTGVWVHKHLHSVSPDRVRQIIGAMILVALIIKLALRVKPRDRVAWPFGVIATIAGAFTGGLAGMSGPPIALWVAAHRWSLDEIRTTLWAFFLGLTPMQIFFLAQEFNWPEVRGAALGSMLFWPLIIAGSIPGQWIGSRMGANTMRMVVHLLLFAVGVLAIVGPLIGI